MFLGVSTTIAIVLSLSVTAIVCLTFGIFIGYFAYKTKKLNDKIERVATVLAQAGPEIAARIKEGSTKVIIPDQWAEDLEEYGDQLKSR